MSRTDARAFPLTSAVPVATDPTGFVPATMWRTQHQSRVVSGRSFILNDIGIPLSTRRNDGEGMGHAQIGTPDAGRPPTSCDAVADGAVYLSVVGPVTNAPVPGGQQTTAPGDPASTAGRARTHSDETGIGSSPSVPARLARPPWTPTTANPWPQPSESVRYRSGR
jgi:hypothetical protein